MSAHHTSNDKNVGFLSRLEVIGNRLPHPTLLFLYLSLGVIAVSAIASWLNWSAVHPISGEYIRSFNLISVEGLQRILKETVTNFTHFAPVGTVLVAVMGIGVAEHSGLLRVILHSAVTRTPPQFLTFMVVFLGVMSSLAADVGYVVLIPLAALVYQQAGRSPLVGMAAAFAGVSGGYSANLLIGPLDAILAGLSTEAAHLVDPAYLVDASANYYFIVASTLLVSTLGTWVTDKLVEPRVSRNLSDNQPSKALQEEAGPEAYNDRRGLTAAGGFSLLFISLLCLGLLPAEGVLRDPLTHSVLRSPFINGIVVIIAVYAALTGYVFARFSGRWDSAREAIIGMENSMATMGGYLVLMFFAAQFVSYFNWSQLGSIAAIEGASWLKSWGLPTTLLLTAFVILSAFINLLVGSASAKWALLAPIFIPMLMLSGISPEATQLAFRIGDSSTNIITPLMPYFGVVLAYFQRYQPQAGLGTIMSMMLPYSITFLVGWTLLLIVWVGLGWSIGPGVSSGF